MKNLFTAILAIAAVLSVWWVVLSDPWIQKNLVTILIVIAMIVVTGGLAYVVGYEQGEASGHRSGYDAGFDEGRWHMGRRK